MNGTVRDWLTSAYPPRAGWNKVRIGRCRLLGESEVAQSCPTLCDLMDHSLPGSSIPGFSRQEYWSGLLFPSPGDLLDLRVEPGSPKLQADSLPSEPPGTLLRGQGADCVANGAGQRQWEPPTRGSRSLRNSWVGEAPSSFLVVVGASFQLTEQKRAG